MMTFSQFVLEAFRVDNPGGHWLEGKKRNAARSGRKVSGPVTAYHTEPLRFRTEHLKRIPGAEGEHSFRQNSLKLRELERTVGDPPNFDTRNNPVLIGINYKGEAYILEGNHRVAYAVKHRIPYVYADIRYYAGGEEVRGKYHPSKIGIVTA